MYLCVKDKPLGTKEAVAAATDSHDEDLIGQMLNPTHRDMYNSLLSEVKCHFVLDPITDLSRLPYSGKVDPGYNHQ